LNGRALGCLCVLSVGFAPLASNAFVVNRTRGGAEVKWHTRNVPYWINPSSGPATTSMAIQSALNTWSTVTGVDFRFIYGGPTTRSGGSLDGYNAFSFEDLGTIDGTVAQSTRWLDPTTGEMGEDDIVFNTRWSWSTTGDPQAFDVQNVATHELGHSLSLADLEGPDDLEKTMYGYTVEGETKKRSLDVDDIAGIAHLYPASPTSPTSGRRVYSGLFHDPTSVLAQSSGYFTLTATSRGTFSGKVSLQGGTYPFHGKFDADGRSRVAVSRAHKGSLTLQLEQDGADVLKGTVGDGNWLVSLHADRAVFGQGYACGYAGAYTFMVLGSTNGPSLPAGDSYWTVMVKSSGGIALAGSLADGTKVSQSTSIAKDGRQPLWIPLYRGCGFITGWVNYWASDGNALSGDAVWIKPALSGNGARYYPLGFSEQVLVYGMRYVPPTVQEPIFSFTNGRVVVQGGGLAEPVEVPIILSANNKVQVSNQTGLRLTLGTTRGTFTGSLTLPTARKACKLNGVLMRHSNSGYGYFLGVDQSGLVRIRVAP
jgi:hypothetical protein